DDDGEGGPACDTKEGERLAGIIGDKKILMMASHGVATITPTVSEAFDLLYYTERACQQQILAMQTGRELNTLPQHGIDDAIREFKTAPQYGNKKPHVWHFEAMKRILDRQE